MPFLSRLISIIDATGAASYHGFLPVMVRQCIQAMIGKPFRFIINILWIFFLWTTLMFLHFYSKKY